MSAVPGAFYLLEPTQHDELYRSGAATLPESFHEYNPKGRISKAWMK